MMRDSSNQKLSVREQAGRPLPKTGDGRPSLLCAPKEVAQYTKAMSTSMREMAQAADLHFLAYLLDMVVHESALEAKK